MPKKLLFSVTKKDLKIDFFSGSGGGGQHRNKHQNCLRLHHINSGVMVTGQSHKERRSNIREALKNLVNHPKFKLWYTKRAHELSTGKSVKEIVEEMMQLQNLKVEGKGKNNKWIVLPA